MKQLLTVLALALSAAPAGAWDESDFPPRPVVAYPFSLDGKELDTVIGQPRSYTFARGDTFYDVARHLGLGINETTNAFPGVDVWIPPEGETFSFPTWWILPDADPQGVVVNIPEMRLYYFPPRRKDTPPTVITYPVGLGRDDWRTPTGKFKIQEKTVDPPWVIPDSIREERIREKGRTEKMIPGGDPENPLGHYRMRLTLPLYGIHGTNIAWGVGMEISHGCIRLYPEDIERLFPLVPVGAPGEIVYQPVKIGVRRGDVYIEVDPDVYQIEFDYTAEARRLLSERGWSDLVDAGKLAEALERKSSVPTAITDDQPLSRQSSGPETTEARGRSSGHPRS